ncbi:MAG TPA: hypothetical protein PKN33_15360 [Phycisphaerae bacterium]|nr:hypothetical protein [Phycisphaerae bacterium]
MSDSSWRHIALLPLLNVGRDDIVDFDFTCGAKIRVGLPKPVDAALASICQSHYLSEQECSQFQIAKAWLWLESTEVPGPISGSRNLWGICGSLAESLWEIRCLIDLVGAGENDYWRGQNIMHCVGPYTHSLDFQFPWHPARRPYIFSPPSFSQRTAPWSETRLRAADNIQLDRDRLESPFVPRLSLAVGLKNAMTMYPARKVAIRFALAVSAMETLYIAPNEPGRMYLWSQEIQKRITQICAGIEGLDGEFFNQIRQLRNDAVHRGGHDHLGSPIRHIYNHAKFEEMVRASLRWAISNKSRIAEPFENDEWPVLGEDDIDACRAMNSILFVQPANPENQQSRNQLQ